MSHLPEIIAAQRRLTIGVYLALRMVFILASLIVVLAPIQLIGDPGSEFSHVLLRRAWLTFTLWSVPLVVVWRTRTTRDADLLISFSLVPDGAALLWASQATGGLDSPIYHTIYFLIAVHSYHFPDPFMSIGRRSHEPAPGLPHLVVGAVFTIIVSMSVFCSLADPSQAPIGRYFMEMGLQGVIAACFLLVRYSSTLRSRSLAESKHELELVEMKLERARDTEHQILEAMRDVSDIASISDQSGLSKPLSDLLREIGTLYNVEAGSLALLEPDGSLRSVTPYFSQDIGSETREVLEQMGSRATGEGSLIGAMLGRRSPYFAWNAENGQDFAELGQDELALLDIELDREAARLLRDKFLPSRRIKHVLAVPIERGNRKSPPVGCILLLNRRDSEPFGLDEVDTLRTIARQLAIAVANFNHHQINLIRSAQEALFNRLMLTEDLDDLVESVLRYLNRTYDSQVASLWLATEDGFGTREETLRVVLRSVVVRREGDDGKAHELEVALKARSVFPLESCYIGSFFREGSQAPEVAYLEDVTTVADCWSDCRTEIGTPRLIAIPLRRYPEADAVASPARAGILGVACLRPLRPLQFDTEEKAQLERFADHLAVLMEQVRYRKRYNQIETLKDRLPSLTAGDLPAFYQGLVELVREVLHAEACSFFTVGPEGELILKATTAAEVRRVGADGEIQTQATSSLIDTIVYPSDEESITATIAKRRETTLIYNVHDSPYMSKKFMEVTLAPEHQSLIGAPISKTDGSLIGVLRCINKRKEGGFLHVFVQGDRDFLELTVGIMSRFIENAEADESKRDFLNQLAHELASPLAALRTQIDFLEDVSKGGRHVRNPGEQFSYLREQADYIQYIVSDIQYQFGRGASIRASYDFSKPVDLAPMIERLKKLLLPFARLDRQIDIVTGTSRLPRLFVDIRRMEQVFFNLLQNAVKYSRRGGRNIFLGYEVVEEAGVDGSCSSWHRLAVENLGIGVPEGDEPFIFDEYRRGTNVEGSPSGTGLGLAVARKIAEAHGGRLRLIQRDNPTIFALDLPLTLAEAPPSQ